MSMRTSIEIAKAGYLYALARGSRASYIRLCVDERLGRIRAALETLRKGRTQEEISLLVSAADLPWAEGQKGMPIMTVEEGDALALLWAEGEATGLNPANLLKVIESGKAA